MLKVDIKKRFQANGRVALALEAAFAAREGVTVLFGPSGSGKTTILRAIAGIVIPDEGRIALGDRVYFDSITGVNLPVQQRRVGFVFQDYVLFPHLTAEQNVAYGVNTAGDRAKRERALQMLASLAIEHAAGRYPRELSGGEQQRVALARALASDPAILLLDEPLSAVDVATRSRLLEEIVAAQRRTGIPFLYVTHSHAEAARVGEYMFVLHEGRVVQEGRPLEVFNAPQSVAVARAVGTENIFVGRVLEHNAGDGVTTIDLNGCRLKVPHNGLPTGQPVTVGVRSEDIIVSRQRVTQTSARNILKGTIKNIVRDTEETELVVACGVDFKVSVTVGTVEAFRLQPGTTVYLLVKARACHLLS